MKSTPWLTYSIVAANVLAFLAMFAFLGQNAFTPSSPDLLEFGANHGPHTVLKGEYWRILTSMFEHAGPLHLLLNMYVLWSVGPVAEQLFGRPRYLGLYVLAGVGGGLASLWWHPAIVSVGASGAIFGVFGGLLAYFQRYKEQYDPQLLRKHFKSILAFVGYNVAFGLAVPGIDNAAHLGGLAGGWLSGFALLPTGTSARRLPWHRAAAFLALVAAFGFGCAKLGWRVHQHPDVISQSKAEALNEYLQRVEPLFDAQDSLGRTVALESAPQETQENIEAARRNLDALQAVQVSDQDTAELHAILIERGRALLAWAETCAKPRADRPAAEVAELVSRYRKCKEEFLSKLDSFFSRYHLSNKP